ncbi:MAG: hypothetical protein GX660_25560 [Clostridiaceae bacterium]|nr:hypothetical protein [Clostridiaceae bacterium]
MSTIKDQLDVTILNELRRLNVPLDSDSEESKTTIIDNIAKLYKLKLEDEKNEADMWEKVDARENEQLLKKAQIEQDKKFQKIRLALEAAGIMLPLVFYWIWMKRGLKFEETGSFTSATFRNLFGQFKLKK